MHLLRLLEPAGVLLVPDVGNALVVVEHLGGAERLLRLEKQILGFYSDFLRF